MEKIKCGKCDRVGSKDVMEMVPAGAEGVIYLCSECEGKYSVCYYCNGIFAFSDLEPFWKPGDQHSKEMFFMVASENSGYVCKDCMKEQGFARCEECGKLQEKVLFEEGECFECQEEQARRELEK